MNTRKYYLLMFFMMCIVAIMVNFMFVELVRMLEAMSGISGTII